ncbi:hypothetical protein AAF712_009487 [Marasmius tenuissimus]|uniref:Uncharacterized protein n=1 Tax=Marasmius tenuissimus TaxID=585030 RepID=A0ABR2ZPH4_9AGAR|nr:hypothetical protein PM082_024252 [Marasmius tenuissimus]
MIPVEEYMGLRIQGEAERRWLALRGITDPETVERLIRVREETRRDARVRFKQRFLAERAKADKIEKRLRRKERALKGMQARDAEIKLALEVFDEDTAIAKDRLEAVRKESDWLAGIADDLGPPWPKPSVLRKRSKLPKASAEVQALIKHKVEILYPNNLGSD